MKKILCILLSLMMILPFSACKRESKHPILSETRRPDHTTITTSEETIAETTVPEETAKDDACKVEHHISQETFECLKSKIEIIKKAL